MNFEVTVYILGQTGNYEKIPVRMTGVYFNFTKSLSMSGPPTFEYDHYFCIVGGPIDHILIVIKERQS